MYQPLIPQTVAFKWGNKGNVLLKGLSLERAMSLTANTRRKEDGSCRAECCSQLGG